MFLMKNCWEQFWYIFKKISLEISDFVKKIGHILEGKNSFSLYLKDEN